MRWVKRALRRLAQRHSKTMFVTFTLADLVAARCYGASIAALVNTVRFEHATRFVSLKQLCEARRDCVVVMHSALSDRCDLNGPLRVVSRNQANQQACACGLTHRHSRDRFMRQRDLRHWRCTRSYACCVDLLVINS